MRDRVLPLAGLLAGLAILGALAATIILPHRVGQGPNGVGGPFSLVAQDGTIVTQDALKGHPTLVFFGYTHCPDVCPATLAEISAVFKNLGPAQPARALFVSVDPARDTPTVMKDYLSSFDANITGLTGSPEAIKEMERAYKVYAKTVPDKDGTYTMDHTAMTYLMDRSGAFVGAFNLDQSSAAAAAELRRYF